MVRIHRPPLFLENKMPMWEETYTAKQVIKAWKDLKLKVPLEYELEEKNLQIEKLKKKNKELN